MARDRVANSEPLAALLKEVGCVDRATAVIQAKTGKSKGARAFPSLKRCDRAWAASDREAEFGARERTRTSTTLRSLAPEASASASSATRARVKRAGLDGSQPLARHFSFCPRDGPLSTRAQASNRASRPQRLLKNEESASTNASLG